MKYKITPLPKNSEYEFLVTVLDYEFNFKLLLQEILNENISSYLIDLATKNGLNDRFYIVKSDTNNKVEFSNEKNKIDNALEKTANSILVQYPEIMENSVLRDFQISKVHESLLI